MKVTLITLALAFIMNSAWAQERITGLVANPSIKHVKQVPGVNRQTQASLNLPFFDDFSNTGSIFPDSRHWTDNYVFINDDFAVNPPTIGVATFDAINNLGEIYSHGSPYSFGADTLTSVEIRLDSIFLATARKITTGDSLYFSFFYQPQGYGNTPAPGDSLILEFLAPEEIDSVFVPADTVITGNDTVIIPADTLIYQNWVRMWSSQGYLLEHFHDTVGDWFQQILVPVLDSARFYKPNFRFRFRNYASLADATLPDWQSNGDQWNVDYIYLNIERGINDIYHPDVAFAAKAPNMLSRFTSMPFDQYRREFVNEMADSVNIKITNLFNDDYNATYSYEVTDENDNLIHVYQGGNFFVPPYSTNGYVTYPSFAHPPVAFVYPVNSTGPVEFTTTHILHTDANLGRRENDTIRFRQIFSNYLSYDDGTAEAGYGITPEGAQVAYQFKLNKNDSLFGVKMFFNQTLAQGNSQPFYLNVWNDYFGKPGDIIYSRFGYQPVFTDSLNQFFYYDLDSAIFIEPGRFPNLIFYVGWEQSTGDMLNLGLDKNNSASKYIFYKTFGDWNNSQYPGALMIRPVIGVESILSEEEPIHIRTLSLYPNPNSIGVLKISSDIPQTEIDNYSFVITATDGRTVSKLPYHTEINVSHLANGMYFFQLMKGNSIEAIQKLVINR
ncbi:MAG TPA: T9SS type A sorting domain-containing protein [Lentimicrobium sp.]|nr:T9SS type A sorting domain-containing protein [Lentimicrobium sp.]